MIGLVVIPAYNEELVIEEVLKKVPREIHGARLEIVVIDDGSVDKTKEIVKKCKIKVISHPINRGLGAALGTGFEYARRKKQFDFLVTLDGDGQHKANEINSLLMPVIRGQADFVVGTRFMKKGMPVSRKIITFLASLVTYFFTGVWTTDSQSGFRVFSKKAIESIFIEVDRMEVSTDFFRQSCEKELKIVEIPITPIYTEYSLKKGQNFFNSANIIGKLTFKKIIE